MTWELLVVIQVTALIAGVALAYKRLRTPGSG